jgi:hypothetical protein
MVPNSVIMLVLMVAFGIGWGGYFLTVGSGRRLLLSSAFFFMGTPAAIMLLTLILALAEVRLVWLSWALLTIAVLSVVAAVPQFRKSRASARRREQEVAQRRARGV